VIVNVGHDVIEKPPFFMKPGGSDVIHVNFRSAEVDPVYFPQIEVVGDIANAIWQGVTSCKWEPGADASGKPTSIWVILPLRFEQG